MAAPFNRTYALAARCPPRQQITSLRSITTSTRKPAAAVATNKRTANTPTLSDAELDALASRPGVTYTRTTSSDDLSSSQLTSLPSLAYRELTHHREQRALSRLAAWSMPTLSTLSQPFTSPPATHVLKWRYTTYMGESHPAANKVVVEFRPGRISSLTPAQREKLIKLAGPRYKDGVVRMSCEAFASQAQNKRYLGDVVGKLVAEAKSEDGDSFVDVPRDTRHVRRRRKVAFPEGWKLTEGRREALEERRRVRLLEEGRRVEEGRVVSGLEAIETARRREEEERIRAEKEAEAETVMVGASGRERRRG